MKRKKKEIEKENLGHFQNKKKRRDNKEICHDIKNERAKYYSQRTKLLKSEKGQTEKQQAAIDKKILRLNKKIDSLSVKIFKCGKKYAILKKERISLQNKVRRIVKKIKTEHDFKNREINSLYSEIGQINERIRDLDKIMGKPIIEQKKGIVGIVNDSDKKTSTESVVIWRAKKTVESLLSGSTFETLTIEGDTYSLRDNKISAIWHIDAYLAEIMASQKYSNIKTPIILITIDLNKKTIEVN